MSNDAQKELNDAVKAAEAAVQKACEVADKHGLSFDMMDQRYVGDNNGKRLTIADYWDGVYYDDMEEDDERFDPDYEYAGWQNSSTFC